ncbi:MAG: hypothetical protein HWD59_03095 [Coxiellaceae bacterium]|nr:MAG: hypothetical protein HWD59_03095 [Coxiellaceae bacterium]
MEWMKLLYVIGAILVLGLILYTVRSHPQAFSRANLSKSITVLGVLALLLIGFIALIVWWLRTQ